MVKKGILIVCFSLLFAGVASAQQITFDYFYQKLSPYGEWIEVSPYGWVWSPTGVEPGWRPYTDGSWTYTDYGWTFVSDDDWGWAVYHYGRWVNDAEYGWIWIPGTVWGPAWVAWRYGDDFIGWAPLPPAVGWSDERGLVPGDFDLDDGIAWSCWVFVQPRWFVAPRIKVYLLSPVRNVDCLRVTKNVTIYKFADRRIFNAGIDVKAAERFTGKRIVPYRIGTADKPGNPITAKGEIRVFKPAVTKTFTAPPKEFPAAHDKYSMEDLNKRQAIEKQRLNDYYDRQARDLQKPRETGPLPKTPPPDLRQRNENESRNFTELKNRDQRALENRQNRELNDVRKKRPPK